MMSAFHSSQAGSPPCRNVESIISEHGAGRASGGICPGLCGPICPGSRYEPGPMDLTPGPQPLVPVRA